MPNADAPTNTPAPDAPSRHFIQQTIDDHIQRGVWGTPGDRSVVTTRFPPEPNGYLHIGHAKSIWLNFSLAQEFGGRCFLRFDDTNPVKEEDEYVRSIIDSVRWLGFTWPDAPGSSDNSREPHDAGVKYASDYFRQMHDWAVELIDKGLAYVDDQSADEIRAARGDLKQPGAHSPHRDRSPEENRDLFARMVAGEFPDGSRVLRAKIDMASPNLNLRDPVMYRILHAPHHRTGDKWCIYPMYDWAHGLEDSIEGVTHSICTLEFEDHRPLYNWFIEAINKDRGDASPLGPKIHHPQQIEFARLNLNHIVTSKRRLIQLVQEGHVRGWDDPRMPTIAGLRRRGCTPKSIRDFCASTSATKFNAVIDYGRLEQAVRADLNARAPRRMAVLDPVRLVITNWDDHGEPGRTETMSAVNNPEDDAAGARGVPFSRELYIERDDFMEDPPKKFFRLGPGREVRLRYGYWVTCTDYTKDDDGNITEIRCTYDPQTRGGDAPPPGPDGKARKVKGTLHWVSAQHAVPAEVRLFDRLYTAEQPGKQTGDHLDDLNPNSLRVVDHAMFEPAAAAALPTPDEPAWPDGVRRFQFERLGYFALDPDATPDKPVFNRTVTLKDSWAKQAKKG